MKNTASVNESGYVALRVGEPYPFEVPEALRSGEAGCALNLFKSGPFVSINYSGLRPIELFAFRGGLKSYTYTEMGNPTCPVACWIFRFGPAFGPGVEVNFDAKLADPTILSEYLDTTDGVKNAWQFHLLDWPIVKGVDIAGLEPDAVRLFHRTIRKQLAAAYTQNIFDRTLAGVYANYTGSDIRKMGTSFVHKPR